MRIARAVSAIVVCSMLAACGTYIPSQREWPSTDTQSVNDMNIALARTIVCELSYAVTVAIREDQRQRPMRRTGLAYSEYLASWGVEVATDLTVSESTTISPSGLLTPVSPLSAVFTLAGGISGSATSSNENKYNVFYPLAALYKPDYFREGDTRRPCRDPSGMQEGSPLVDIDLRILPLLQSRSQIVQIGLAAGPDRGPAVAGQKNVLTQTVSIKESVSGGITPVWKFTTGTVNPSGSLFGTSRQKTHQVVFTFGPLAPGGGSLSDLAESFHINELLRAGLRNQPF